MSKKQVQGSLQFRPMLRGTKYKSEAQAVASKLNFAEGSVLRLKGSISELCQRDYLSPEAKQRLELAKSYIIQAHKIMQADRVVLLEALHAKAAAEKENGQEGVAAVSD